MINIPFILAIVVFLFCYAHAKEEDSRESWRQRQAHLGRRRREDGVCGHADMAEEAAHADAGIEPYASVYGHDSHSGHDHRHGGWE